MMSKKKDETRSCLTSPTLPFTHSLKQLQELLCDSITSEKTLDEKIIFDLGIMENRESLSPQKRIHIYKNGYHARILESLLEDFPETIETLIKENLKDSEDSIVTEFLSKFPSTFSSLGEISENFPAYVSGLTKMHSKLYYLSDHANLEFLRVLSPLLTGTPLFNFSLLSSFSPDELQNITLKLCPSFLLFHSPHFKEIGCGEYHSIFTTGGEMIEEELEKKVFHLLEKLKAGIKINALFSDEDLANSEFTSEEISELFKKWVQMGALTL